MSDDKTTPAHYRPGDPYEAIKVIQAWGLGFALGNAVKYICRAGRKPGESALDDLRKASWYVDNEIRALSPKPALSEHLAAAIRSAPVVISIEDAQGLAHARAAAELAGCELEALPEYIAQRQAVTGPPLQLAARARGYDPSALTIEQTCELLNFLEPESLHTPGANGCILSTLRKKVAACDHCAGPHARSVLIEAHKMLNAEKASEGPLLDRLEAIISQRDNQRKADALERAELEESDSAMWRFVNSAPPKKMQGEELAKLRAEVARHENDARQLRAAAKERRQTMRDAHAWLTGADVPQGSLTERISTLLDRERKADFKIADAALSDLAKAIGRDPKTTGLRELTSEILELLTDARRLKINLGRVIDSCEVDGPDLISRAERAAEELAELRRIKSVAQITMATLARSGFEEGGLGERVGKLLRLYTRACAELQDLKGE